MTTRNFILLQLAGILFGAGIALADAINLPASNTTLYAVTGKPLVVVDNNGRVQILDPITGEEI